MEKHRVLLAEDDFDFGSILKQYLEIHNFEVLWAQDGKAALALFNTEMLAKKTIDICVFDIMMPKMDGFALAEIIITESPEIPFVFLTAKRMKEDRIRGLKLGADDYIVKPFEADILVLRLQNILKRSQQGSTTIKNNLGNYAIGNYIFYPQNYQLRLNDIVQKLTDKEAQLINYFFEHKNQLVKRDDLLNDVWGSDDFFSGRSMDVFISRLRKYFKDDPQIAIESTRGVGLTFIVP
jgi:DNA-binding response OmpR family regulator